MDTGMQTVRVRIEIDGETLLAERLQEDRRAVLAHECWRGFKPRRWFTHGGACRGPHTRGALPCLTKPFSQRDEISLFDPPGHRWDAPAGDPIEDIALLLATPVRPWALPASWPYPPTSYGSVLCGACHKPIGKDEEAQASPTGKHLRHTVCPERDR